MPAYWIARARINKPTAYKLYTDIAGDVIKKFGGHFLARGGDYKIVEGETIYTRHVVAEFPSMDDAVACHSSSAYQDAAANRKNGGGDVEIIIVNGI